MSVQPAGAAGGDGSSGDRLRIIIGLKRLADVKQRLSPDLTLEERRDLMLRMLHIVVAQARGAGLGAVTLASSEPTAPDIAASLGVEAVSDGGLPWNQGLVRVLHHVQPMPEAVLYLAGDLPLVTADELREFVDHAPPRGIAIARARDGGTNALLVRPAAAMPPLFGHARSSVAHAARGSQLGLEHRIVDIPGLALDVDTAADARDAGLLAEALSHVAARNDQRRGR